MLPGLEMMACPELSVPREVMHHVAKVESSFNPYAIGVVGGRLARQPRNLGEALSTTRMLEREGYNFSLGIAQVNRYNLSKQGLASYEQAFAVCPNLQAGSRILAECYARSGKDWGKAFSCYYSGNFTTGFRHGYVQKVVASWRAAATGGSEAGAIPVIRDERRAAPAAVVRQTQRQAQNELAARVLRRVEEAALSSARNPLPAYSSAPPTAGMDVNGGGALAAAPVPAGMPAQPAIDDDAPVVVQPMGARSPVRQPVTAATQALPALNTSRDMSNPNAVPAAQPQRDAAFVF